MSRSNYDKPFYVDVGTSIVAVRCASNHDVVIEHDHVRWKWAIEEAERVCDRLNAEVDQYQHKMREALENIVGYAETARCHTEDVHILSFLGEIEGWACSALAVPVSSKESLERPIDSNEKATHSSAVEMQEACRAMNDDGDPTLCEELKCPYYGEPNGCNSPTGECQPLGSATAIRKALDKAHRVLHCAIIAGILRGDDAYDAMNMAAAALSKPARNCELYDTYAEAAEAHKEYATAYIARASNKFDFPMEFDEWLFALAGQEKEPRRKKEER